MDKFKFQRYIRKRKYDKDDRRTILGSFLYIRNLGLRKVRVALGPYRNYPKIAIIKYVCENIQHEYLHQAIQKCTNWDYKKAKSYMTGEECVVDMMVETSRNRRYLENDI